MNYIQRPDKGSENENDIDSCQQIILQTKLKWRKRKIKKQVKDKREQTEKGITPLKYRYPTYPKEMAMIAYSTLQTGPNNQEGGAHSGLISV